MCGIFGIWNTDGRPIDLDALQRANNLLRHRGPDDEGYLLVNTQNDRVASCGGRDSDPKLRLPRIQHFYRESFDLALGFRRLAILDLSPLGHQPMSNEDGHVWIVLNGEIYNYLELRKELEDKGHRFQSHADTETLLHGYEEYGEGVLDYLNGMFAFALWDRGRLRLFCARDRLGIKPFYYFRDANTLIFSSEIKAILLVRPDLRSPHFPYLKDFIRTGLLDHSHLTFFSQVYQLQPSHFLTISPGSWRTQRYWDFEEKRALDLYDYQHPGDTLSFLLRDAVRLQLRSDVPVGTCLSGGLDSSSIVALASSMLSHSMNSFSCVYEDAGYQEGEFVEAVASAFNTNSHVVRPTSADFLNIVGRITWHMDEPTAGPGVYSQWFVMKAAQGKVKVLLDGQGGDELFGGYHHYFFPYLLTQWHHFIAHKDFRRFARMGLDAIQIWRLTRENYMSLGFRLFVRKLVGKLGIHRGTSAHLSILHPDFEKAVPSLTVEHKYSRFADHLNDKLYWDTVRNSIPALLHYEDRNSMAFGIEARVPLLDHRLVEFCLGLPSELKIQGSKTKVLLREVMADLLPSKVVNRRDKKGYPTPLAIWLRDGLYSEVRDFLLSPQMGEPAIFDLNRMEKLLKEHWLGKRNLDWEIFRWISCKLWFQILFQEGTRLGDPA